MALVDDEIVGVARYESDPDRPWLPVAEIAVTVEDAWQHRGLGILLSRRLASLARRRGFVAFTATVLGENRAALRLMRSISPEAKVGFREGTYGVYAPLRRRPAGRSVTR